MLFINQYPFFTSLSREYKNYLNKGNSLLAETVSFKQGRKRIESWGLRIYNSNYIMRDIEYKIKTIRMNEKTWENLKRERKRSKLSWNLFLVDMLKLYESQKKHRD